MSGRTTSNKRKSQGLLLTDSDDAGSLGMLFDEDSTQALKKEIEALKKTIKELQQSKRSVEEEEESSDDEDSVAHAKNTFGVRIQELREFRQVKGHCKVPYNYTPNMTLGFWVNNQRSCRKKKTLPQDKIDKLDSIGFDWGKNFDPPQTWETAFSEIKNHKETFGSCEVAPGGALGKWSNTQRKEFKRAKHGKDTLLTLDQIKQLNSIGFKWKGSRKA
jgi:hypothetical protein